MELLNACVSFIASRGFSGSTWPELTEHLMSLPSEIFGLIDECVHRSILLMLSKFPEQISFTRVDASRPRKGAEIYSRDGFLLHHRKQLSADEIRLLVIESVGLSTGEIVLVASRTLRRAYLGVAPTPEMDELSPICYCVLEAIGRTREVGCAATELGEAVQQSAKNVFTHVNRLETLKLVFRDSRTHTQHCSSANRLWLSKYHIVQTVDQNVLLNGTSNEYVPITNQNVSSSLIPQPACRFASHSDERQAQLEADVLDPFLIPLLCRAPRSLMWEDELMIAHLGSTQSLTPWSDVRVALARHPSIRRVLFRRGDYEYRGFQFRAEKFQLSEAELESHAMQMESALGVIPTTHINDLPDRGDIASAPHIFSEFDAAGNVFRLLHAQGSVGLPISEIEARSHLYRKKMTSLRIATLKSKSLIKLAPVIARTTKIGSARSDADHYVTTANLHGAAASGSSSDPLLSGKSLSIPVESGSTAAVMRPSSSALEAAAASAALLAATASTSNRGKTSSNVSSDRAVALPSGGVQERAQAAALIAQQALAMASQISTTAAAAAAATATVAASSSRSVQRQSASEQAEQPLFHQTKKLSRPVNALFKRRLSTLQTLVARELIVLSPHARQYLLKHETVSSSSAKSAALEQRQIDRESALKLYATAKSEGLFESTEQLLEPNQSVRVLNRVVSDTLVLHVPGIDLSALAVRQFMRELQHTREGPDWNSSSGWSQFDLRTWQQLLLSVGFGFVPSIGRRVQLLHDHLWKNSIFAVSEGRQESRPGYKCPWEYRQDISAPHFPALSFVVTCCVSVRELVNSMPLFAFLAICGIHSQSPTEQELCQGAILNGSEFTAKLEKWIGGPGSQMTTVIRDLPADMREHIWSWQNSTPFDNLFDALNTLCKMGLSRFQSSAAQIPAMDWIDGNFSAAAMPGPVRQFDAWIASAPIGVVDGMCIHFSSTRRVHHYWQCVKLRCSDRSEAFTSQVIPNVSVQRRTVMQAITSSAISINAAETCTPIALWPEHLFNTPDVDGISAQDRVSCIGFWSTIPELRGTRAWTFEELPLGFSFRAPEVQNALAMLDASSDGPILPLKLLIEKSFQLDISTFHIARFLARRRIKTLHLKQIEWDDYSALHTNMLLRMALGVEDLPMESHSSQSSKIKPIVGLELECSFLSQTRTLSQPQIPTLETDEGVTVLGKRKAADSVPDNADEDDESSSSDDEKTAARVRFQFTSAHDDIIVSMHRRWQALHLRTPVWVELAGAIGCSIDAVRKRFLRLARIGVIPFFKERPDLPLQDSMEIQRFPQRLAIRAKLIAVLHQNNPLITAPVFPPPPEKSNFSSQQLAQAAHHALSAHSDAEIAAVFDVMNQSGWIRRQNYELPSADPASQQRIGSFILSAPFTKVFNRPEFEAAAIDFAAEFRQNSADITEECSLPPSISAGLVLGTLTSLCSQTLSTRVVAAVDEMSEGRHLPDCRVSLCSSDPSTARRQWQAPSAYWNAESRAAEHFSQNSVIGAGCSLERVEGLEALVNHQLLLGKQGLPTDSKSTESTSFVKCAVEGTSWTEWRQSAGPQWGTLSCIADGSVHPYIVALLHAVLIAAGADGVDLNEAMLLMLPFVSQAVTSKWPEKFPVWIPSVLDLHSPSPVPDLLQRLHADINSDVLVSIDPNIRRQLELSIKTVLAQAVLGHHDNSAETVLIACGGLRAKRYVLPDHANQWTSSGGFSSMMWTGLDGTVDAAMLATAERALCSQVAKFPGRSLPSLSAQFPMMTQLECELLLQNLQRNGRVELRQSQAPIKPSLFSSASPVGLFSNLSSDSNQTVLAFPTLSSI